MRIIWNDEVGSITLVPMEEGETEILNSIIAIAKPEDHMNYGGVAGKDGSEPYTVYLHIGSHTEMVVKKTSGGAIYHTNEEIGGIRLELRGSGEEDEREVRRIRDTCFFGSGGLIFIGSCDIDDKKAIVTTAKRCKFCNAGMIKFGRCEWNICDTCADKCDHDYKRGMVHGGSAGDMGMGEYCAKCGRSKPEAEGERKKGKLERELEVQKETGIDIFYRGGPVETPQQAVQLERALRRHRKANSRV